MTTRTLKGLGFLFLPDSYRPGATQYMGFQSANRALLEAMAQYGTRDPLHALTLDRPAFDLFASIVQPFGRTATWIPAHETHRLAEAGTVFVGGSSHAELAGARRATDPRAFGIVGILHSFSTGGDEALMGFHDQPIEAWDAVVCTSAASYDTATRLLDARLAWIRRVHGAASPSPIHLAQLPLGVHADRLAPTAARRDAGAALRAQLGVREDAVVVLYFGRLSWIDKANPVPMFQALEAIARAHPDRPIALWMAGWAYDQAALETLGRSAKTWCPSVPVSWLNGMLPKVQTDAWAGADVFVSLADNLQETFGLTPLEAMAAGLPCVVSDWDGYRDTVRHGVDGFRIPTVTPPPGAANPIIDAFPITAQRSGLMRATAQCVAVDVEATRRALEALILDPALRRRMGEAGRERVASTYDWRVLVPRYEALLDALDARRAAAPIRVPAGGPERAPRDPFAAFARYPTRHLKPGDVVVAAPDAVEVLERALRDPVIAAGVEVVIAEAPLLRALIAAAQTPIDLARLSVHGEPAASARAAAWLLKTGTLRLVGAQDQASP